MSLKFDELKKLYGDKYIKTKFYLNIVGLILEALLKFFFRPNSVAQLSSFYKKLKNKEKNYYS